MKITTCFVGSYASGKTTMILKYLSENIEQKIDPTIGMSGMEKTVYIDNISVRNLIFDTAGQERFTALIPIYLRGCDILVFTIDTQNYKNSFNYFKSLIHDIIHQNKFIVICLTKMDDIDTFDTREIEDIMNVFNKTYKILYTSCIKNKSVFDVFNYFLSQTVEIKQVKKMDELIIKEPEETDDTPKNCCILS